ncbi:hypothetical protein [Oceanobacillus chungangensis]|uniref:Uncharacterized protein n=1 Tax=Oceanobacillus chungangensis TaxID=1229152 RepID=A0A3D8PHZ5_9BACI|nr:hypothetical protein [Oceanobacillus chungangensis]RDW15107.1 hypothetical protein CWR45_18225 [Oceanobacillus chungangensis]
MVGNYYYLDDLTTELFLSKEDAKEWQQYYDERNQIKLEEVTLKNETKELISRDDWEEIVGNEALVTYCDSGICEIHTVHSSEFRAFAVPEIRIRRDMWASDPINRTLKEIEAESEADKDSFWEKMNKQGEGILNDSSELITIYESGESEASLKQSVQSLYDKVYGKVTILRDTLVPRDKVTKNQYNQLLMDVEFLLNSLYQGQLYFVDDKKKELKEIVKEEIIPLRNELEELVKAMF